jgi:hypothetical protein
MTRESPATSYRLQLKPHGCSRFVSGAFLAVWLCGWAAGEAFAMWLLVRGGLSLINGTPPSPGHHPLPLGPALGMGAFLLFWLALWTVGGVAALSELLRLLWGEDRIEVVGSRLAVTRQRGPFRTTRSFDRISIRRIAITGRDYRLILERGRDHVVLSNLGTPQERVQGANALRAALGIQEDPAAVNAVLPKGWEDIITPDGARVLVADRSVRHKQTRTAFIGTLLLAAITLATARDSLHRSQLIAPSLILLAFTLAALTGTLWLARGRYEWRIEKGVLTLRKRYGGGVRPVFQGRQLLLDHSTDSDGDPWFELFALSEPDPPAKVRKIGGATVTWRSARSKTRRSIARRMNDTGVLRDLGNWLARESGLDLEDRSTPTAQAQSLAELRATLEQTGRFGRLAAKLVDRLGDKTPSER